MDLGLTGKVAMVGGASKGLGFAVARLLAAEGAKVSMVSREKASIEAAANQVRQETSADVLGMNVDVRSAAAISQWFEETRKRFGGVDLLFANSGGPPAGTFTTSDDKGWQDAFELLLLSTVRMVRAVIPSMKSRGGGSILLSTSSSVKEPIPTLILSNVIRPSVTALSKSLANELALDLIRVNHIVPGRFDTARVRELDANRAQREGIIVEEVQRKWAATIPLGRYGKADEFAAAAVFLLSGRASFITGATLQVDGGMIRSVV